MIQNDRTKASTTTMILKMRIISLLMISLQLTFAYPAHEHEVDSEASRKIIGQRWVGRAESEVKTFNYYIIPVLSLPSV